ncbi:hypothetical protein [Bdellovibrio sp. NC01]|uniref:hypothetical protein n=1 Tax=Bdellovibrio sp. NC01 TaxID=2220073 RepID=UPI00115899E0|nr:hypothetical protein [Bdellovibrio sp. NC01]QDK36503.1 hypothetical protein DOE51_02270 [Bdellovibrio sp. NC01]
MGKITGYFAKQVEEIKGDIALIYYGAALCIVHIFTFTFWNNQNFINHFINRGAGSEMCWPFFPDCPSIAFSSATSAAIALYAYLALAIVGTLLFLFKKVKAGYWTLIVLVIVKVLFVLKSYNFMGNYHYMPLWASVAYLLFADKVRTLFYLIVSFYMGAGLIKFNYEWLSGASLLRPAIIGGTLLGISLLYVILFEMCFCWGLLVKRKWLFWLAVIQVFAFHAFSWHIVGYFYPCVMSCTVSIYVLKALQKDYWRDENFLLKFPSAKGALALLAVFWLCQLVPKATRTNSAVDGLMRIPSLNMLDARTECHVTLFEDIDDHTRMDSNYFSKTFAVRTKCDPVVYLSQVNQLCKKDPNQKLHLSLQSRLSTDDKFYKVLDIKDACHKSYNLLWAEMFEAQHD